MYIIANFYLKVEIMSKHLIEKENKEKKFKLPKIQNIEQNQSFEEEEEFTAEEQKPKKTRKNKPISAVVISALLLGIIPFLPLEGWMIKAAYAVALLVAALELLWDFSDNIQAKNYFADENIVLITAFAAFALGLEFEAVFILIIFGIIRLIDRKLEAQSREKIENIAHIESEFANVETAEGLLRVSPDYVNVGDIVHVEAGETIPLDGVVTEGISTIDTSSVSGQSSPWAVNEGYRVFSGCRNITSPIKIRVSKSLSQSTAGVLIRLVESSVNYSSGQQKLVAKIKKYYGIAMLIAAIALAVCLSLVNGQWLDNAKNSLVLLASVISCTSFSSIGYGYIRSIGLAAEKGVFAKGADCIESMAKAETVVFDKTGIITEGRYTITDVFPNKVSENELLSMAATAEAFSRHPVAVALREAVGKINVDYRSLQIEEIPGRGISAFVADKQVYVGNTALLEEHGIKCAVPSRPGAAIHVAVDYKYWGHILVTDRIRRGVFDSLENLRAQGVKKMVLLTGDVLSVAKPLASKLNFDMLRAELKPAEKASAVEYLMANRGDSSTLAFVGDGSSDGQIMSHVDVGIALGALGSDAAFSDADVLIMDRDIKKLPNAFSLSRLAYRVSLEIIICWLAVNSLIIILGIIGVLPVLAAVIIEFILTCAAFANTMRIK